MEPNKLFISAERLSKMSFDLADVVHISGYKPTWVIGLWRGGAPVALRIHEYLKYRGVPCKHFPLCVQSYQGMQQGDVKVFNADYIISMLTPEDKILIVDDLYETGNTIAKVRRELARANVMEIKTAVLFSKSTEKLTQQYPDFILYDTSSWVVFDHELEGLSNEEMELFHPEIMRYTAKK